MKVVSVVDDDGVGCDESGYHRCRHHHHHHNHRRCQHNNPYQNHLHHCHNSPTIIIGSLSSLS